MYNKSSYKEDLKPIITMPAPRISKKDIILDGFKSDTDNLLSGK